MLNASDLALIAALLVVAAVVPPVVLRASERWGGARVGGWVRPRAAANIVTQAGIIVTGGLVRLTGSGLGCSDWPECEPGSFTPVVVDETSFHPFVEFGNRVLTFVLLAVAVLLAIAVWNALPKLRWWGLVPYAGVVGQAIIGGITVLVDLHPLVVAPHLLLSVALVWQATWLWTRVRGERAPAAAPSWALTRWLSLAAFAVIVVLGALTTGAGPHSGDAEATERLALDPASMARAHAVAVWAFCAVLVWWGVLAWRRRDVAEEAAARRAWLVLAAVTLAQGAVGYVQYFTGLPEAVVAVHLAGIGAFAFAHALAFLRSRPRDAATS